MHMKYHPYFWKMCHNINFNEYENHCSQKQKTLKILFIIDRCNHNWYIFNKKINFFSFFSVVSGCDKLF